MKASSLRLRITTWYVSLLATALIVFGAAVYLGLRGYLQTSLQHELVSEATAITTSFLCTKTPRACPGLCVKSLKHTRRRAADGLFASHGRTARFFISPATRASRTFELHAFRILFSAQRQGRSGAKPSMAATRLWCTRCPIHPLQEHATWLKQGRLRERSTICCAASSSRSCCSRR